MYVDFPNYEAQANAMSSYASPYYQSPLPVTHLHETYGQTHHHVPFPILRHKVGKWFHNSDLDTHLPMSDVRETPTDYFVDLEFPGVSDKSKILVRWVSSRTLLVQAGVRRPHIPGCPWEKDEVKTEEEKQTPAPEEKGKGKEAIGNDKDCACSGCGTYPLRAEDALTTNGQHPAPSTTSLEEASKKPHLTLSERQIGYFARNFSFPVDVDHDHMKATLSHGLLSLQIPKAPHEKVLKKDISVQ